LQSLLGDFGEGVESFVRGIFRQNIFGSSLQSLHGGIGEGVESFV
jgi:hypothetical protein